MLFFPSVTFGLLSAEIFPWAAAYALKRLKSISYRLFPIVATTLASIILTLYIYNGQFISESIRSIFAYANPLFLLMVLACAPEREIFRLVKILKYVLGALLAFGIVQGSGLIEFVDPLVKALVPRGGAEEFGGGRGVMLLSTEPSRAAFEIIFLYAAWRTITTLSGLRIILIDILFALFIVGIIKSALGLALLLVYLFFIYRLKLILLLLLLAPIALTMFIDARAVSIAVDLASKTSPIEAYEFFVNASGFRLISVLSSYYYGLTSLIGGGVGAWPVSSINAMQATGFSAEEINYFIYHADSKFTGIRPTSYMANIALDMGLLGVACLMYLLIPYIKRAWACGVLIRPLLGLFLFSLFFIGAVGNPIPWLAIILAIRYLEAREGFKENARHASNAPLIKIQTLMAAS